MGSSIVPIVEGHSEVESVPLILRHLLEKRGQYLLRVEKPVRVKRYKVVKEGELERALQLARSRPDCAAIMVILDGNDDCPKQLAPGLLDRAKRAVADIPVSVVMPKPELETWFLASIESLIGVRGIKSTVAPPDDPESVRDAKGWLTEAMEGNRTYVPTDDQPAMITLFDHDLAQSRSRSFRKFLKDFDSLLESIVGVSRN